MSCRLNKREKDDEAQIHHSGSDEDAAGEEVRMVFALGPARKYDGGDGGRISAAEQCGEHDAALILGQLLQYITGIGNCADGHDDEPGLEGVDVELR